MNTDSRDKQKRLIQYTEPIIQLSIISNKVLDPANTIKIMILYYFFQKWGIHKTFETQHHSSEKECLIFTVESTLPFQLVHQDAIWWSCKKQIKPNYTKLGYKIQSQSLNFSTMEYNLVHPQTNLASSQSRKTYKRWKSDCKSLSLPIQLSAPEWITTYSYTC